MTKQRLALAGTRNHPAPNPAPASKGPAPEDNPRRRRRKGGGKRRRKARRNPVSVAGTLVAVGLGAAAVAGGYVAYRGWQRVRGQMKMTPGGEIAGLLSKGATLADSPQIVSDVRMPVQLAVSSAAIPSGYTGAPTLRVLLQNEDGTYTARDVANVAFGLTSGGATDAVVLSGRMPDGSTFEQRNELPGGVSEPAVARLVTDVKGTLARDLYERMLAEIVTKKVDWEDPAARDASIKHVLGIVVPQVDYSRGLEPYSFGDLPSSVWSAAQLMGALAQQSMLNKALQGGG
jgi:hypothetical protein